jgi:hypothetical protein
MRVSVPAKHGIAVLTADVLMLHEHAGHEAPRVRDRLRLIVVAVRPAVFQCGDGLLGDDLAPT